MQWLQTDFSLIRWELDSLSIPSPICATHSAGSVFSTVRFAAFAAEWSNSNRDRPCAGTNVVYKKFPFHPVLDHFDAQYSFSAEDMVRP